MSISTLESLDSVRMLREIDRMDDQRIRNEIGYMQDFTQEVMTKPLTSNSKLDTRRIWSAGSATDIRPATVWEVMADTLDYSDGPQLSDALAIIVRVAREGDIEAQSLIARMSSTFAKYREEA
jgi:hypothetical protein